MKTATTTEAQAAPVRVVLLLGSNVDADIHLDAAVDQLRREGGRRFAQQPLNVHGAQEASGRGVERRPTDERQTGQGRGQLLVAHHRQRFGVEGLLLFGREHRVEGLGGVGAFVHFGLALGAQGTHLVDALWRGQLGKGFAVAGGRAFTGLHGLGVGGPGRLLRRRQLQFGLEFFHALLHMLHAVATLVTTLVLVRLGRFLRCCGLLGRGGSLGKAGQAQRGEQGGCHSGAGQCLAKAGHVCFLFG